MGKWRNFSQKFYDNFGSKLQPKYNRIKDWKTPEWAKKALGKVWDVMDKEMKKKLYKFVMETCKQLDEEYAKALIDKLVSLIKKTFS